jgi:hypothetical protein
MPDPEKLLHTVRRATKLFRSTPGRVGGVVAPEGVEEVMVVGDLHGNIPAFRRVLEVAVLNQNPGRHLVLQELIHGPRFYPEGGDQSHQLLDMVASLKCRYPDRVHLILGNHELSELTGRIIRKRGVVLNQTFREGISTAYGDRADAVYEAYKALFAALPLAIRTPNRVFLCHTIPNKPDLDRLDLELLKVDTWPPEAMARRGTIYALTWGRDSAPEVVDRFAAMVDADWFITGHQPCDKGFRLANQRQIIIDGSNRHPAYCLFPTREPVTIEALLAHVGILSPTA